MGDYKIAWTVGWENWCQGLVDARHDFGPTNSQHYLYEIRSSWKIQFKAFTQDEVKNERQNHKENTYRKLSLSEIVDLTDRVDFIKENTDVSGGLGSRAKSEVESEMIDFIKNLNVHQTDAQEQIAKKLKSLGTDVHNLSVTCDILETMQERSLEKTQGIWAKLKWYIWSWFGDQSEQINQSKRINNIIQKMKEDAPSPLFFYQSFQSQIQLRVFENIKTFEKEAQVPEIDRTDEKRMPTLFTSPKKVKEKWLTKCGGDKYDLKYQNIYHHDLTVKAKDCRTTIIALLKIWDGINKVIEKNPKEVPDDFEDYFCEQMTSPPGD